MCSWLILLSSCSRLREYLKFKIQSWKNSSWKNLSWKNLSWKNLSWKELRNKLMTRNLPMGRLALWRFFIELIIHNHAHWNTHSRNISHVSTYSRHRIVCSDPILTIINWSGNHCLSRIPCRVRIPSTTRIYIISQWPWFDKLNCTFPKII